MATQRSHDEATIAMLRDAPEFMAEYLRAALEGLDEEGGDAAFLMALRHVVEARGGFTVIAERARLSRESLYRALSPDGNPTLKTMKSVLNATGFSFASLAH